MKPAARSRWLVAVAAGLGSTVPELAPAQTEWDPIEKEEEELTDRQTEEILRKVRGAQYGVDDRVSRYLGKAAELIDEEGTDQASELLANLNADRLNPYERALLFRLQAYVAFQSGNHDAAIGFFQQVIDEKIMPLAEDDRTRFYIGQLYAAQQEWDQVIEAMDTYLERAGEIDPLAYYLLGISNFQLERFDQAIEWGEKAIAASPEPKESWLQLVAALYVQQEDYASAAPILEELLVRFPKKIYWVQLSLIYGAREDHRRSLAAQQVAHAQGFLEEDKEIRRLVRGFLFADLPYPGAKLLAEAIESGKVEPDAEAYEMLANSWIAAREYDRSLPPLEEAAKRSDDGNLYVRLGQVRLQREEWALAAQELQRAIAKGGLRNPGNAQLLLGIAYYNDERVAQAHASFQRARQHESTRTAAENWLAHLEREAAAQAG